MTTITKTPRQQSRHDATLIIEPDTPRAAALAKAFRARTTQSPYAMTRVRARKCRLLYEAGFSTADDGFVHPAHEKVLALPEAVNVALIVLAHRAAAP